MSAGFIHQKRAWRYARIACTPLVVFLFRLVRFFEDEDEAATDFGLSSDPPGDLCHINISTYTKHNPPLMHKQVEY